ncbi:MAG: hypothetical protein LAP13_13860 [Acidobacteriia bacterium]|nr:hypothetical protein [Terriglobia bacterium]
MNQILRGLIIVLSLAGLADALYFTFAYYGRIKKARWIPEILCAREGSNCVMVVQTPYARVFGVPNSLLGIVYYLVLIAWATKWRSNTPSWYIHFAYIVISPAYFLLVLASAVTVLLGFYLVYALRRKLHIHCPLCYTAHAINTALFVLLIALAF